MKRDCKDSRQVADYCVRVIRPHQAPLQYTTRACSSLDAANEAMDKHGIGTRVTAKAVKS